MDVLILECQLLLRHKCPKVCIKALAFEHYQKGHACPNLYLTHTAN